MRKDMGKCIIEAPRHNSSASSAKARYYGRFTSEEDGPNYDGLTRLPSSRKQEGYNKKIGYKNFSDKLGPLRGYLVNNCGRPWNDVYSEIAEVLGRNGSWGVRHIIDAHLNVAVNTWRGQSGKVYSNDERGVSVVGEWRSEFYVEPETGILRESPRTKRPRYRRESGFRDVIPLGNGGQYQLIDRIWYYVEYERRERSWKTKHGWATVIETVMAVKKQLNTEELLRAGLRNGSDPPRKEPGRK